MGMVLISYPKLIYIQSTEPTNKTIGLLWYDIDDGKLYSADGNNYNEIGTILSVVASDTELINNAAERNALANVAYTLRKQMRIVNIPQTNTLRIKFESEMTAAGETGKVRLYKNGVSMGGVEHDVNDTYSAYSEDITNVQMGDLIQLYEKKVTAVSNIKVKKFKFCGTATPNEAVIGAWYDKDAY